MKFFSNNFHPVVIEFNKLISQLEHYQDSLKASEVDISHDDDLSHWSSPALISIERSLFIYFQFAEQVSQSNQLKQHDHKSLHDSILKLILNFPVNFTQPYFKDYFERGGKSQHPFLGHLYDFRRVLEQRWKEQCHHFNTIGFLIFQHVPDVPDCQSSSSVTAEPAKKRAKCFALA
jgi:hypothetical protein